MSNTSTTPLAENPMSRLFKYLGAYRNPLGFASSSSVINRFFDMMPPFLTAWMMDSVSGNIPTWIKPWTNLSDPWQVIIFLTILTLIIFGCESFFEWLYKRGFMRLAQRVQHDLRLHAYTHLQKRELAYFEDQRTGNLMSMLNDDINQLERFLNTSFNEIIQIIILVLFAGWSMCSASLILGLVAMFPIPLIILGSFYYQRKVAPYYKEVRQSVGMLSNRLENNISGIQVIKSFTAEDYETKRVAQVSEAYRNANFNAIRWSASYIPIIRIFITLGFAGVLLVGSYWVINDMNGFTFGSLAFFAMMTERLLWPVTGLGRIFDDFERARASAARVFGLLDTPTKIDQASAPKVISKLVGNISLEKVEFYYKSNQLILKNLNLQIKANQMIGIAGPTGGGKTTLIKLLLRLYDVTGGSIQLDGINIKELDLYQLRQQIALVSQNVYLFHGSISDNIAYGQETRSLADIQLAAKKAKLHDFISSLPDTYDAIIGERGIKLSGGQRQRLSIARAILKDAPILILDEATSAVDTETERAIQQNLNRLTQNKTAIVIAHRLSTIRHADTIIVLKEGTIAEQGTHEYLISRNGIYADLWQVQIGGSDIR